MGHFIERHLSELPVSRRRTGSYTPIVAMTTMKTFLRALYCLALCLVFSFACVSMQAQSTQFLPEVDTYLTFNPMARVYFQAKDDRDGGDPTQATLVLDAPCVEPLHARLKHSEDGRYLLLDQGSTAGTWVNYAPISGEGAVLEHGDLIHIGKIPFRFELGRPTHLRKPTIKTYNENQ